MLIFNFLLASDAVGGLGPPADLVNKSDYTGIKIAIWIFLIIFAFIIPGIAIIKYKCNRKQSNQNEDTKSDE